MNVITVFALPLVGESPPDFIKVDWFYQMIVEAGVPRASLVLRLAIAGQRNQPRRRLYSWASFF